MGRASLAVAAPRQAPGFWMEDVGPAPTRPPLAGALRVDVAIVGGGFTGLWTAYQLLVRDPGLAVAVLEREAVGFGASGRNGSWCIPELNASPARLERTFGRGPALDLHRAMCRSVDAIGAACQLEGIDARFEKSGVLMVARGRHQLPSLQAAHHEYLSCGLGEGVRRLDAAETRAVVDVAGVQGSIYTEEGASLHPGRLARGLADAVERRGGTIYEGTEVSAVVPGATPRAITAVGAVSAGVVVLALEAYLTQLPGFRRRVLPIYSLIDLTEPLTEAQLESVNWRRRICLASMRLTVDYLALTSDRRVLVGGRGAPYRFGSAIAPGTEAHAATHTALRAMFQGWFPELAHVRFTHSWGGVLGMPRDWIPSVEFDRRTGLALACGYTGHGVATTHLAGSALADLITDEQSQLTELCIVGRPSRNWEPEPLRWLGVRYVQSQLNRLDRRGEGGGRPPSGRTLAERLATP